MSLWNVVASGPGRTWNFIKRHKKKLIFAASMGIGGYYLYKASKPIIESVQAVREFEEKASFESRIQKEEAEVHTFENHMKIGDTAVRNFAIIQLRPKIITLFDVAGQHQALIRARNDPSSIDGNSVEELWQNLKISTFSQVVALVYGVCLLNAVIRVQLCIYGRYVRSDMNDNTRDGDKAESKARVHKRFISLCQHVQNDGLRNISKLIREAVEFHTKSWSLEDPCSFEKLIETFSSIFQHVDDTLIPQVETFVFPPLGAEESAGIAALFSDSENLDTTSSYFTGTENNMTTCSVDTRDSVTSNWEAARFSEMVGETRNILNNVSFLRLVQSSIRAGFGCLQQALSPLIPSNLVNQDNSSVEPTDISVTTFSHLQDNTIDANRLLCFAKVIPCVANVFDTLLPLEEHADSALLDALSSLDEVKSFCSLIYLPF